MRVQGFFSVIKILRYMVMSTSDHGDSKTVHNISSSSSNNSSDNGNNRTEIQDTSVNHGEGGGGGLGGDSPNRDEEEQIGEASITTAEILSTTELTIIRGYATDDQAGDISGALLYCKRRILFPYLRLLGIMGLKPTFNPESHDHGICIMISNKLYFTFVVLLLLAGYTLQYMTCFRRDRGFVYKEELLKERLGEGGGGGPNKTDNDTDTAPWESICFGNPVLIHVFPSIFHLSSFLYMVFLYRFSDDEQLPNLMERVFIQAAHAHSTFFSQKKLVRTLQWLVFFSIIWVLTSTACQLIQICTHEVLFNFYISEKILATLLGILAFSTSWQDAIQVTVIISYSIHCILLSTYLNLLYARVQQHTISLSECIKEIGEIEKLTSYVNNDLSTGLGPLLVLDAATAVSSIGFLAVKGMKIPTWDFVSLILVAGLWVFLFIFPLTQAATLSSACKRVREIGHLVRLRPFGYQDVAQSDLDSFLLFVSTMQMEVRILKIPVSTPILAGSVTLIVFLTFLWGFFISSVVKHVESAHGKIEDLCQSISP